MPWPPCAAPAAQVSLCLDAAVTHDDPVRDLSAAVCLEDTLILGSDEGVALEWLQRDGADWRHHQRIDLGDCLDLVSADEADIEGLAVDGDWLWIVGSHARTRPKLPLGGDRMAADRLCDLRDTRPRCLLARLPLQRDSATPGLVRPVGRDGKRRSGLLKQGGKGNALAAALAADPLLKPFTKVAAKEGGIDIEGIAVDGMRVALGMRGPVIQTHALLLEITLVAKKSGRLALAGSLCKRLLDLEGLGIRDLKRLGDDLLILAGPTTHLDGPCALYRWRGWRQDVPEGGEMVCLHRPERILELPFGRGNQHPEGLAVLASDDHGSDVLVVCDGPDDSRFDPATRTVRCDIFRISA